MNYIKVIVRFIKKEEHIVAYQMLGSKNDR